MCYSDFIKGKDAVRCDGKIKLNARIFFYSVSKILKEV